MDTGISWQCLRWGKTDCAFGLCYCQWPWTLRCSKLFPVNHLFQSKPPEDFLIHRLPPPGAPTLITWRSRSSGTSLHLCWPDPSPDSLACLWCRHCLCPPGLPCSNLLLMSEAHFSTYMPLPYSLNRCDLLNISQLHLLSTPRCHHH